MGARFQLNMPNRANTMPAKIAVIADIHLPDVHGTAQEAALAYALNRLRVEKPDVVLIIGDATACGTLESAERVRTMLDESGLCFRMIPGNSDERTPALLPAVTDRLTADTPFYSDEYVVCLLDITDGKVNPRGIDYLKELMETPEPRPIILGSHYPIAVCMEDPYVHSLIEAGKISLFIGAHAHRDQERMIAKMSVHTVRGLDPDKAIGAPPAVTLFEFKDQEWRTFHLPFEEGTVTGWSSLLRREFIDYLGFSCMSKSLEGLHSASLHDVWHVELRAHNALAVPREELLNAVRHWREAGGKYLSMHMPDLSYGSECSAIAGADAFRDAVSLALELEVEHMTLHVPRVSVEQMRLEGNIWGSIAGTFLELIKEPIARGMVIGVENLHMSPTEPAGNLRGFGYLPAECHEWVKSLRKASGYDHIGIHLDIGHARNNAPFSKKCGVGQWYALIGKEIIGYHLHQVTLIDGIMRNHYPIMDIYGPLISLSSFFWGWKTGCLCHAPMFLEIRSDNFEDTVSSLQYIRQYVRGELSN
jgi:hypothetical protein